MRECERSLSSSWLHFMLTTVQNLILSSLLRMHQGAVFKMRGIEIEFECMRFNRCWSFAKIFSHATENNFNNFNDVTTSSQLLPNTYSCKSHSSIKPHIIPSTWWERVIVNQHSHNSFQTSKQEQTSLSSCPSSVQIAPRLLQNYK